MKLVYNRAYSYKRSDENIPSIICTRCLLARWFSLISFSLLLLVSQSVFAQINTWTGATNANWNTSTNWSLGVVPTSAHDVVIPDGSTASLATVTINTAAICNTFTINGGDNANTVTISSTNSLTVTNGVTIGGGTGNGDNKILDIGVGSMSCSSVSIQAPTGGGTKKSRIAISTGTVTVNGNITMANADGEVTFSGSGVLNIGGTGTMSGGTFTPSTSTANYNGTNQNVGNYTYHNLSLSGIGSKITVGVTTVNNNLTIADGTTFTAAGFALTVTGTTTVGGGSSGNLTISSATGTKTFNGDVTLNAGSTWNESAAATINFGGDLLNNAVTFTASTGTHTFSGASKTLSGTTITAIPTATFTGAYTNTGTFSSSTLLTVTSVTLTNNGTVTASTRLTGTGTFSNGPSGILNLSGSVAQSCDINTLTNAGTVNRSGTGTTTTALANFTNTGTINITSSGTIAGITNNAGGTVNHSGSSTITSFNNATSTSILNISTTPTVPTFTTLTVTASGNTVNYNGGGPQTVIAVNYQNLTLSVSGMKTLQAGTTSIGGNLTLSGTASTTTVVNLSITGNLAVGSGTTFTTGANFTLGVTGTTNVTGSLVLANTGTKTFTGDVTLNSGAVWNESGAATINFGGSLTNNATTFTANTGTHNFTGASKTLSGGTTTSIPTVAMSGSYTNSGTLTVNTGLSGGGSLTNNGTLNIGGTSSITTLTNSDTASISGSGAISTALANFTNTGTINLNGSGTIAGITNNAGGIVNLASSGTITSFNNATSTSTLNISATPTVPTITTLTVTASGNTVNYNGAGDQTVRAVNYQNLTLSGSGTKTLQAGTTTLGGNLTLGGSANATAVVGLTVSGNLTLGSGTTFSAATFTHNVAGNWVNNGATFNANASTITFNGTTQIIGGSSSTTFNNLSLTNSGSKTIDIAQTITGDLSISGTAVALLADGTTSSTNTLTLGGTGTANGSWGGTASAAANTNATYFGSTTTGIVNVTTSTCSTPNVSDFSAPSATAVCTGVGTVVTINSTSLATGTYTVTYSVSGTNTVSSTTAGMSFIAGSPGTGTFTTVALSNAGINNVVNITAIAFTSSPNCKSTVSVSTPAFTTFARPTVTFTVQPGASACTGHDVTYTTQAGQTNYVWNVPGVLNSDYSITSGGTGSTSNTVTLKWLTTGSKTVTINYSNSDGCSANSPTSSTATTVNASPTPSFTAQPGANTCSSTNVTYTTQSGQSNYQWTFPGTAGVDYTIISGGTTTSNTVTLQYLSAGSKTVSINYTNASNCSAPSATLSSTTTVTITPNTTGLSATVGSSCSGSTGVPVSVSSSNLASGTYTITYNLNVSGGGSQNGLTASMTFTSGSPGSGSFTTSTHTGSSATVTILSLSINGCSTTLTPSYTTGSSTNNPLPDISGNSLSATATNSDIGNPVGSTVTLVSTKLTVGVAYTIGYTVTNVAGTITHITDTRTVTFVTSTKRNRIAATFTTGPLSTAGQYKVNITSITLNSTGCTSNPSNVSATFNIVGSFITLKTGLWDEDGVWSASGGGAGPNFTNGTIIIAVGHTITFGATAVADILELDEFIIRGTLVIESGQQFNLKNGAGVDMTIEAGGKLIIGSPSTGAGDAFNGTLVFENGVSHAGTSSTAVEFRTESLYQHLFTTTEGVPPLASWAANSTCSVEGYTSSNVTFASTNWSQNFGNFVWNCASQSATVNTNGLLTSVQGDLTIQSTGNSSGIVRFGDSNDYTLAVTGNFNVSGSSRFSTGPTNGNGPTLTFSMNNFTYGSSASSWLCEAGLASINVLGNFQINSGTLWMSSGSGNITRTGGTMNVTGDFTVSTGSIFDASDTPNDKQGKLVFTNAGNIAKTHLYTINGTITGQMLYELGINQIVRTVNESPLYSSRTQSGTFIMNTGSRLIVESTNANGAIQTGNTAGNLRIAGTASARVFASGSTIEYGRTSPAAQFISGTGHPTTSGVHCIINNSSGVTVTAGGTVDIGGNLTVSNGNLTVAQSNLIVRQTTNTTGGNILVNHRPAGGATTFQADGAINMTGGNIQFTSSITDDASNAELEINGDLQGTNFFTFSGNNCRVRVGGSLRTFSRAFPINSPTTLENILINAGGTTLVVDRQLTLGNPLTNGGGVTLTNGNLDMDANLIVTAVATLTNGKLFFEGVVVELQRNINTAFPAGVFSSNSGSTLNITSNFAGVANTLAFDPSGNTLGTLTLNRTSNVSPHVTLNSALIISGTMNLTDGEFYNQSGLNMANDATIVHTPNSAFTALSAIPTGGPYNITYTNGSAPVTTSLNSAQEAQGSLNNVTSNLTGTATLTSSISGIGLLTVNSGVFDCVTYPVSMGSVLNQSTLNAPNGASLTLTGNFTNNGTFTSNSGASAVVFDGTSVIAGSSVTEFNHLTLNANRTLAAPAHIRIKANLVFNTGSTFNHNNGNVELTGTDDQHITTLNAVGPQDLNMNDAKAAANAQLWTLTVSNTKNNGKVTLQAPLRLGHLLDIKTETDFESYGNLILLSQNNSTALDARIGPVFQGPGNNDGKVSGAVQVQRFMGAVVHAPFRYISSPVSGGAIPALVDKLYRYDQAQGWVRVFGSMPSGEGYTALSYNAAPGRWDVTNNVQTGSFTYPPFNETGWYLLGNPFPSPIQWKAPDVANGWDYPVANVATMIGITDNTIPGYPNYIRYFDYRSGNPDPGWGKDSTRQIAGPGVIAMGQSFWVYVAATQTNPITIIVNEAAKVTEAQNANGQFYREKNDTTEKLAVHITNGKDGDRAILVIDPKATDGFDFNKDFPKFWNMGMNVYLKDKTDQSMLMLALSQLYNETKIPLGIQFTEAGEYTISFTSTENFSYASTLYLVDSYEGVSIPVASPVPYTFTTKDISKPVTDRFYFALNHTPEISEDKRITVFPNPVTDQVHIQVFDAQHNTSVVVMDLSGKILIVHDFAKIDTINMSDYPAGMYILKVKTSSGVVSKKIFKRD